LTPFSIIVESIPQFQNKLHKLRRQLRTMGFLSVGSFSRISKGTCFTFFLLVAVALLNSNAVEASRDLTITASSTDPDIIGVWNDTFKTENSCIKFHPLNESDYFFLWPEPHFKYCCGWGLGSYTYTTYGPQLQTTLYYDVGPVDTCLPYWRCLTLSNWRRLTEYGLFEIACEMGDMQTFYAKRLMRVVGLNGLVQTALPLVAILEVGVFLAIVALSSSGSWRTASAHSRGWRQVLSLLCRRNYANNIGNLVHLCVLVVIGNCFMEATGHSNQYLWESGMFLKGAQFYLLAPSILTVAMFFHQTADWGAARNNIKDANAPLIKEDTAKDHAADQEDAKYTEPRGMSPPITAPHEPRRSGDLGHGSDGGNNQKPILTYGGDAKDGVTVPNEDDVAKRFVPISEDWRWQPVCGQIMVLVLTGFYCVYNSDDHRTEFVSFVLGVAVVFGIWSFTFSCALLLRSVKCLDKNLRLSRPSPRPADSARKCLQATTSARRVSPSDLISDV
jgi:hypothetical protein